MTLSLKSAPPYSNSSFTPTASRFNYLFWILDKTEQNIIDEHETINQSYFAFHGTLSWFWAEKKSKKNYEMEE